MPPAASSRNCAHESLLLEPSIHAAEAGYRDYTPQQLANASGHGKRGVESPPSFPRPLVLPGDDLSEDPRCPGQSLRSWLKESHRNEVTSRRNIVYVAAPPAIDRSIKVMDQWARPHYPSAGLDGSQDGVGPEAGALKIGDVEAYLGAFYTGLTVSRLSPAFTFTKWDESVSSKGKGAPLPAYVGLQKLNEVVGIRVRQCPDDVFKAQLNLNDVLDAAISALPDDAYALLLVVHQDLFEDDDDDFCCGRAYGGSRIAVVSSARYNPTSDEVQGVERDHAWPASHCAAYVNEFCETATKSQRPSKKIKTNAKASSKAKAPAVADGLSGDRASPISAAVLAHKSLPLAYSTPRDLLNLWIARVCRTASHELGHCFGMAHCVHYACVMQSTASLAEDIRQPPYLCPVDLAKLLRATGTNEVDHYAALQGYCNTHHETHMFAALGAWCAARLVELKDGKK